jgi:RNA polymerase sigma-B factor
VTSHYPHDDAGEEWLDDALRTFAISRDPALRAEIAERSLWLAERSARRFADRGEPFDDIVQVASIALIHAIDRFQPAMGVPFGAYATPTIVGEIKRHFRDRTWRVHVPRRAKDLRPTVNAASEELSGLLGRSPTTREIAAHLEIEEDLVLQVIEANSAYRTTQLDGVADRHIPVSGTQESLDAVLDRDLIRGALAHLRPREREIIEMRFLDEMTQAQIAERIGTSQVHVGRLITSSLALLRAHLAAGTDSVPAEPTAESRYQASSDRVVR